MSSHDPICAALRRLVDAVDGRRWDAKEYQDAIAAARAALATPPAVDGPAVPQEGREPAAVVGKVSDEDLYDLAELFNGDPVPAMRRALELWGRPTPAPVEGEVGELAEWLDDQATHLRRMESIGALPEGELSEQLTRAAALLQQQAAELARLRAGMVPVPVAERPWERPGWCDESGRCWAGWPGDFGLRCWQLLNPRRICGEHVLLLPAHALPLPAPQGGEEEP